MHRQEQLPTFHHVRDHSKLLAFYGDSYMHRTASRTSQTPQE